MGAEWYIAIQNKATVMYKTEADAEDYIEKVHQENILQFIEP